MTIAPKNENVLWKRYESALEDYTLTRDLDDMVAVFKDIIESSSPKPPIALLSNIANRFAKIKRYNDAKLIFGMILQEEGHHRETWKALSSLYFKLKDNSKAEFCLQKYYSLKGGSVSINPSVRNRLASAGKLKSLPSDQQLGLQKAKQIQNHAPKSVLSLDEFYKHFKIKNESLPPVIKRIIQFAEHQIVDYRFFDKQSGEYGEKGLQLLHNEEIIQYLKERNITRLYKFQEEAFERILSNQDVVICAPTGNGKTEAFLLPALLKIKKFAGYGVQLLIIYPQKALAKDQLRKITEIANILKLSAEVFDGDTSQYRRRKIFADPPEILITNPDILHYHLGIGKNSGFFQNLISNLKIVVLDEVHTFSGTFGSNMHFILRRLERILDQRIQYIAASATVANPQLFTSRLLNRPITVIECQYGRRGRLHFLMIAPFDGMSTFDGISSLLNSIKQFGKILAFQDSHRSAEYLFQRLRGFSESIGIHRAGLSKKIREEVEAQFREGEVDLLIATPTLELGIDIGELEIVVTPPISVNRAIQRIGRAGRKGQDAVAIIHLNSDDPISHYYYSNPERYFQEVEDIFFDPTNPNVVEHQLLAAALDHPLGIDEFPENTPAIQELEENNYFQRFEKGIFVPTEQGIEKARKYSIRGTNHEIQIKIRGGRYIGKRAMPLAMYELYPGAYYLAGGTRYRVFSYRFNGYRGTAELVKPKNVWGQTFPVARMKPQILEIREPLIDAYGVEVGLVTAKILQSVVGYTLQTPSGTEIKKLRTPQYYSSQSRGLLFQISLSSLDMQLDQNRFNNSLHTLVHVLLHASLPFIGGQIHEIGGLALLPQGYILLFDQATGYGICEMLLRHLSELFTRARKILDCDCQDGCPKCCYLHRCSKNNASLEKEGAQKILDYIIQGAKIPLGTDYNECRIFIS
ncbi:MAG: DEAD/DEAH box helicase [Candidatus Hodarchaeales archaeon]|jgi:DEAD/DEAH box helicase domain-containing protein